MQISCFAHTAAFPVLDLQYLGRETRSSPVLRLLSYLLVVGLIVEGLTYGLEPQTFLKDLE